MKPSSREAARAAILRLCATDVDSRVLWARATELLRATMPFGTSCWHHVDPATLLITSHFNEFGEVVPPGWTDNEYLQEDVGKFADLARSPFPAATLRTLTQGHPERSARYEQLMVPRGWGDELRVAFVDGHGCWGTALFLRERDRQPFDAEDAAFVAGLSPAIAEAMRRSVLMARLGDPSDAPGVIVLDASNEVESLSQQALRWLAEIVESESPDRLPAAVYAVVDSARLGRDSARWVPAKSRAVTSSGRWLVIHGALMEGGAEGRVAVIVEPARAPEIAPLVAAAYALTVREREVAERVMQGLSTQEIAGQLYLSPYTVQDHLKAIFEKVGVRSRRQLIGRVFADHYRPALRATEPNI